MYKMPIGLKIVIFILLVIIMIGLFNLILAFKTSQTNNLTFEIGEFNTIFLFISIIGILLGIFFLNIFRSWTPEILIEKMENVISINNLILGLQMKKIMLILKNPELKQIDTLKVEDIETGKAAKK